MQEKVVVYRPARVSCDDVAVQGEYSSKVAGSCVFTFDNSFSYLKGKNLK